MSKKEKVEELLKKDISVEDICKQIKVSPSYVYRLKREMDESEGDKEEIDESEDSGTDDMVVDPAGGAGVNVEGNDPDLAKEKGKGETDKTDGLGGVKKKKKVKKSGKSTKRKVEKSTDDEDTGGILKWIMKKWKTMLLVLSLSILLVLMMLFPSRQPEEKTEVLRYPMMHR